MSERAIIKTVTNKLNYNACKKSKCKMHIEAKVCVRHGGDYQCVTHTRPTRRLFGCGVHAYLQRGDDELEDDSDDEECKCGTASRLDLLEVRVGPIQL